MSDRDAQAVRYWPTPEAYALHLARGACGHIVCAHADRCALEGGRS